LESPTPTTTDSPDDTSVTTYTNGID
jgi:hypothetical protein